MQLFTLKVTDVARHTPDVVTICFKQPGLKKLKYKPGQYLTLIIRINGRKYARPYSFSSAPNIDQLLEITLKRIPGGVVSNYLYDNVKVADMIEVMEPMGDFVFDIDNNAEVDHIMLWGAGTGITPLLSILKTVLHLSANIKVDLFYCNRDPEHTIFHTELETLQKRHCERFQVHNFYTQVPEDIYLNYHIKGRPDEKKITALLNVFNNLEKTIHFICGPGGLKAAVITSLKNLNISSDHIFSEEFEVLIDPQEFDDIETRNIVISKGTTDNIVEVTKGRSILDAGLDQLIDLPYSCQTGTCMLCKAKLQSGCVKVIGVENSHFVLESDECLLCCSYPYTDDIQILIG
jgi:ring-1,2-phenylacetyl-CoA epoxidase subunit PaaE